MQQPEILQHVAPEPTMTRVEQEASRIRQLFEEIADLPEAARQRILADRRADADEIRAIEQLIQADRHEKRLFEISAMEWAKKLDDDESDAQFIVGQRAGPYEILKFLGKGGSSIVFLANRTLGDTRQLVALKVLHSGLYSSESRRRFRREQAILSRLSHPNIARLVDAGILDSGTPYIAMEYIGGVDILAYADANALNKSARVRLLIDLCRAVDTAHRALVVHRDLKPSNVLVSADGQVRVLDFGIAKLLDDDSPETAIEHVALTPAYAAPEQFDNGQVTTSTDVYSLGVLAGELLTGSRPGEDATWDTSSRTETTTRRARRRLDSDILQILRTALASRPEHRYSSAGHMADDLVRYLRKEPLQAAPASGWYRFRKFVVRNRGVVVTATIVSFAVVCGIVAVAIESAHTREEADRANTTRDFLISVFKSAGGDLPRDKRPSVETIVEESATHLLSDKSLSGRTRVDLLLTLAKVALSVGATDRALNLVDHADEAIARIDGPTQSLALRAAVQRALVYSNAASSTKVIPLLTPLKDHLTASDDPETAIFGLLALGDALVHNGKIDQGLAITQEAIDKAVRLQNSDLSLEAMAARLEQLVDAERFRDAADGAQQIIDFWRRIDSPMSPKVVSMFYLTAISREAIGDVSGADAAYREAIRISDEFFEKANGETAWAVGIYGTFLVAQGRLDEAKPYLERGLQMRREVYGEADPRTLNAISGLGKYDNGKEQFEDAVEHFTQGIDVCRKYNVKDVVCSRMLSLRARAYANIHRFDDANRDIADALAEQKEIGGETSAGYAYVLDSLVDVALLEHDYEKAVSTADQVLTIRAHAKGGMLLIDLTTRFYRAKALSELHRNDEALKEILEIEPRYAASFPDGKSRLEMLALKAHALAAANRTQEAKDAAGEALEIAERRHSSDGILLTELRRIRSDR